MPSDTITRDRPDLAEAVAAGFAKQAGEGAGQLVPAPQINGGMPTIVTAQKVAVERDEAKILARIRVMAQAAGEDWFYRYPARNADGSTGFIEGPSIKCANNVARMYGNCEIDTRVIDNGDSWVIYAKFADYETGFSYTRPFQQRKNQRAINAKDGGRLQEIALQIGISKSIRNVITNALETFTNFAFEEAKAAIVGRIGDKIDHYRERVMQRLGELKVEATRVEATIGRGHKDWLAPDIAKIIAQLQAINDGMATIDETWPPQGGEQSVPPRPTREQFEDKQQDAPQPFEVWDVWGASLEHLTAEAAIEAYQRALDDGEAQKGEEGLRTVQDNNGPFFIQLQERGLADVEKDLSLAYGKRREAAAAKTAVPRGTQNTELRDGGTTDAGAKEPPGTSSDHGTAPTRQGDLIQDSPAGAHSKKEDARLSGDPPAGEPWQSAFDALAPQPPKDDKAWAAYAELAITLIKHAGAPDLDKLRLTDNAHMRELRKVDGDLYREVTVAITNRVAELRREA